MIHRPSAENRAQGSLLSPSCPGLPAVMPDSAFPLIGRKVNVNVGTLCDERLRRKPDRGGPCHVLMSGLSIMQYLMREQADITGTYSQLH